MTYPEFLREEQSGFQQAKDTMPSRIGRWIENMTTLRDGSDSPLMAEAKAFLRESDKVLELRLQLGQARNLLEQTENSRNMWREMATGMRRQAYKNWEQAGELERRITDHE